jgi:hypothetical protein
MKNSSMSIHDFSETDISGDATIQHESNISQRAKDIMVQDRAALGRNEAQAAQPQKYVERPLEIPTTMDIDLLMKVGTLREQAIVRSIQAVHIACIQIKQYSGCMVDTIKDPNVRLIMTKSHEDFTRDFTKWWQEVVIRFETSQRCQDEYNTVLNMQRELHHKAVGHDTNNVVQRFLNNASGKTARDIRRAYSAGQRAQQLRQSILTMYDEIESLGNHMREISDEFMRIMDSMFTKQGSTTLSSILSCRNIGSSMRIADGSVTVDSLIAKAIEHRDAASKAAASKATASKSAAADKATVIPTVAAITGGAPRAKRTRSAQSMQ